ncbi:DHH family phosphoesterase [Gimesia maris]|uniref:NanoRNase/pAp phosphatase n=2 Tax=Gimesia maris TaxID=122 RepID=A0ABX5YLP2_9PLAN|nr:bifunctional oligoribonuclease/PAP phosphatase NrnA [Gimesia maris]QDU14558.1 NanoRNase/pAp phosphatase [Gimesia maris]QEG16535.1 NanoRNase/pAp phosphatase [Gimesia maris]
MSTINWAPLCELIHAHQKFLLSCHVRPDADALGSELALACFLRELGKDVRVINPSAHPKSMEFLVQEHEVRYVGDGVSTAEFEWAEVHIVLDTSAWSQLPGLANFYRKTDSKKVIIDHHVSSDSLGAEEFKDVTSPATGCLVYDLGRALNCSLNPEIATLLYAAIATDTGWFRFPSTTAYTMQIISELIKAGAEPHQIYELLYEQNNLPQLRLMGRVLGQVQTDFDGLLAYTIVSCEDFSATGTTPVDTEGLVNYCLTLAGTQAAFIAVEQRSRQVKISFRSRTAWDVSKVAESFGGGGHRQASGAMLNGPLSSAVTKVLGKFREMFDTLEK